MTSFKVQLDVFRGGGRTPLRRHKSTVQADTPLGAMRRAEDCLNVLLPDDQYAAARNVWPTWDPRTVAAEGLVKAA